MSDPYRTPPPAEPKPEDDPPGWTGEYVLELLIAIAALVAAVLVDGTR